MVEVVGMMDMWVSDMMVRMVYVWVGNMVVGMVYVWVSVVGSVKFLCTSGGRGVRSRCSIFSSRLSGIMSGCCVVAS